MPIQIAGSQPRRARRSGDRLRKLATPYMLLFPSAVLIFGFILYPIVAALRGSLFRAQGISPVEKFVGVANFQTLFGDPIFQQVLWQTALFASTTIGITMVVSIGVALLLNQRFAGRRVTRAILIFPWATSLGLSAAMWRWVFEPTVGMLNEILRSLGLIQSPIGWLGRPELAFPIIVFVGIWVSVPFTSVSILAGLQSVSEEVIEAAIVDGAIGWNMVRFIILPLIRPVLVIVFLLNFVAAFNQFPIIWVLTEGGPVHATEIASTWLYKVAFKFLEFGPASAIAVIVFVLLLVFSIVYMRVVGQEA
jgi:multiple sugar transport system permease protein